MTDTLPFWKHKTLEQMTSNEWESLCDGCGLCCLHKLEDDETGIVYYTQVACRLLDIETCRCKDYEHRRQRVPDCLSLRSQNLASLEWLPPSCAYRLVSEGQDLPDWHPLVCGNPSVIHEMKLSIRGFAIEEQAGMELENYLLEDR